MVIRPAKLVSRPARARRQRLTSPRCQSQEAVAGSLSARTCFNAPYLTPPTWDDSTEVDGIVLRAGNDRRRKNWPYLKARIISRHIKRLGDRSSNASDHHQKIFGSVAFAHRRAAACGCRKRTPSGFRAWGSKCTTQLTKAYWPGRRGVGDWGAARSA